MMGLTVEYISREEAVEKLFELMDPNNYDYTRGVSAAIDLIRALPGEEVEVFPDDGK